jgi:TolA-binding protein
MLMAALVAVGLPAQTSDAEARRTATERRAQQELLLRQARAMRDVESRQARAALRALEAQVAQESQRAFEVGRRVLETRERVQSVERQAQLQTRSRLREAERELAAVSRSTRALAGALRSYEVVEAPVAWLPQDPADSLYRRAREQLAARRYADAADSFYRIIGDYPRSGYVGDAHYFAALARTRIGGRTQLMQAAELLQVMEARYASAATAADARALRVRIEGMLAARGDARAAQSVVGIARGQQTACDDEEQALRATALSALLQMDPDRARPILMEVLSSRDECAAELRAQAIFILAQEADADDPALVELLVDLAVDQPDPDPEVREAAVFWLAQSDSDAAVDALLRILRSPDASPEMSEHALFALGQSGNPRAMEALREFARSPNTDRELRANAIFWLANEGDASTATFLRSLYDSIDDPELKERIFFAIAESGDEDSRAWLTARAMDPSESVEARTMALFWAGEAGISPEEILRIYRSAEDPELREQAIFVLTQVADDGEAVDALMEVARSEEDAELRQRAIFWLGESNDPRVPEFLMEILRGGGGA